MASVKRPCDCCTFSNKLWWHPPQSMDHSHKSNNAPLPYHKNTTSEQKCTTERRYFYIYIYRHKMYPTCPACVNISVVIYIDKNCVTITATKLKPVQKRMLWCAVKYEDIRGLKKLNNTQTIVWGISLKGVYLNTKLFLHVFQWCSLK